MSCEISGLNHSGKGDFTSDDFTLQTSTQTAELSFNYGGIPYLIRTRADVGADLHIDNKVNKYTFKVDDLSINDLKLHTEGFFQLVNDSTYDMDIQFNGPSLDFKSILSLVPAMYTKDFAGIKTSGQASLSLIISLDNARIPEVSFTNIVQRIHDEGRRMRTIFRGPDHYGDQPANLCARYGDDRCVVRRHLCVARADQRIAALSDAPRQAVSPHQSAYVGRDILGIVAPQREVHFRMGPHQVDDQHARAERLDVAHVVAGQQHGDAAAGDTESGPGLRQDHDYNYTAKLPDRNPRDRSASPTRSC